MASTIAHHHSPPGIQLGSSGNATSGNVAPALNGFNFFNTSGWWKEFGRDITGDAVASNSASLMSGIGTSNLHITWSTGNDKGGNGRLGMPFNVVPGPQTLRTLTNQILGDPGPVPARRGPSCAH